MKGNPSFKIAMIGHKRVPSRMGGVELVVEELSRRLGEKGHDLWVYNRREYPAVDKRQTPSKSQLEHPLWPNVHVVSVPTIKMRGLAALSSSFFATLKAMASRPDLIHYHAEGPSAMLILPRLKKIKTVATIHGLDWQRAKWGRFASWYLRFGEKIAAKKADAVIVLSRNMQQYFKDTYGRHTIFIPNGVTKPSLAKASVIKQKYGLTKNSYLLFLSRIVPEKGLRYLIEAYKQISTNKKLVIAGDASDSQSFLEEMHALALEDERILFVGFVEGKELDELYSNAHVFVLPSDVEGMPLALLEAMAYGNCCLVSNIPENKEVVGKHGLVFEQGSVADLKSNIRALLNDTERVERLKVQFAEQVLVQYNWNDVVDKTLEVYESVIREDPASQ